ncbi:MAG: hypothetical protein FJX74_09460 [Armatimonadetes bacterium]|nr:hypothetical protein [Armatimonadota bacterium]
MPPGTFYPDYSLPADLAWLPTGDAFYVGWAGGASPHDPPVVEVATGACRHLTPEEVAWLLQPGRLDERAHDYLQGN